MANLKQLKIKRQSVDKTRKVTKAMEAVSAVKMRKSQESALSSRAFAQVALRILNAISKDVEQVKHPLVSASQEAKTGLLLVSSDKGLAGSLNSAVLKKAQEFLAENGSDIKAIAIGRRAFEFLKSRGVEVLYFRENNKDDVSLEDTLSISSELMKARFEKEISNWSVAYMNFVSTFEQKPVLRKILPLSEAELESLVEDIAPKKGKYSELEIKEETLQANKSYLIEANEGALLDELIPELLNVFVHHVLLESKASEHSARMVAMKAATDKAGEMSHDLLLKFNKARQAAITREVSEITSGVEAMKEG